MKLRIKLITSVLFIGFTTFPILCNTSCSSNELLQDYTNNPEAVGFDSAKLNAISEYIQNRIDTKVNGTTSICYGFPSLQMCVVKDKKVVYDKAFGQSLKYDQGNPNATSWSDLVAEGKYGHLLPADKQIQANRNTLYDLASNTKMYASMLAIQNLLYRKKIDSLDDKLSKYIPKFHKTQTDVPNGETGQVETVYWENITIRQILCHEAGFIPTPSIFVNTTPGSYPLRDPDKALGYILDYLNLEAVPGTRQKYSDVDFMLVAILVKEITGMYIDEYCNQYIYNPLGLKHTTFNPLTHGFKKQDCAATELRGNTREFQVVTQDDIRTKTIQGEVHDEVAYYVMKGVSGHAGLFSTASDLSVLMNLMLYRGELGNCKMFDSSIYNDVTQPRPDPENHNDYEFATGWKTNFARDNDYFLGTRSPKEAFGHDGWTGTFTLIDPVNNLTICILTNAIHTILYDHDPNGNLFFGKQHYFVYDEQKWFLGSRIGGVLCDLIYEAFNH